MTLPDTCLRRRCDGELEEMADDPLLPPYVLALECVACGEVYEYDREDGHIQVDA